MRLHSLTVTAFGPFPDTVEVDFDAVARDGLFLLWGPTGAGKTTLLDAVVYAFYGTVPGARGEERRFRSDHALDAVRTEVTCDVTLGRERLRVIRRPEQQRPKKRGGGTTTEQARLTVQRWTELGWEPVSTRIDEGSEFLRTRLGLSAEQFCQVVLLPQGDFARFLHAEPEDRSRLLRTLFDVQRFADVEEWLAAERSAARDRLQTVRTSMTTLLGRIAQIADVDVPEDLAPELAGAGPGPGVPVWISKVRATAAVKLQGATEEVEAASARSAAAQADMVAARALADRHDRRDRARAALDELLAREPELIALRAVRDAGRRAEPLRDVLEAVGRSALDADRAAGRLAGCRRDLAAVADGTATALSARALRDEAAGLQSLLPDVDRAAGLRRDGARLSRVVAGLARRCDDGAAAAALWPQRIAEQEELVAAAQEAAARLPGIQLQVTAGEVALAAAREASRLGRLLPEMRDKAQRARELWVLARERWLDLRAQRLDGMAAELAAALVDGHDCPVCGAIDHPRPAVHDGPVVTAADEQRLRDQVETAEAARDASAAALDTHQRDLALLRGRASDLSEAELLVRVERLLADLRLVEQQATGLPEARRAAAALTAGRESAAALLAADREERQARAAELAAVQGALAGVLAQLDEARGADADLPSRIARLTVEAERCEAVLEAEADELRARAAADTARSRADQRAAGAGFGDLVAAAAALLDSGRLAALDSRLDEHDHRLGVARTTLADPELADLDPRPSLELLGERCAVETRRREEAVAELYRARRCAEGLAGLAGDVTAVQVELDEREADFDQISGLADLVNGRGSNTLRMRLQSFVLAARLEQVAEVASRRLHDMSAGRYTFRHSDARGRHGARGGLGLDVFDEYTGCLRATKTLSGGESFMASLALALGLADVVTAETGGVQIDTLFVDEGFGTLDALALDAVMSVLDELRRGGRSVGVISHLEELRLRIPSRLEVIAGRDGSRLAS